MIVEKAIRFNNHNNNLNNWLSYKVNSRKINQLLSSLKVCFCCVARKLLLHFSHLNIVHVINILILSLLRGRVNLMGNVVPFKTSKRHNIRSFDDKRRLNVNYARVLATFQQKTFIVYTYYVYVLGVPTTCNEEDGCVEFN